jgi:hypothetical protein
LSFKYSSTCFGHPHAHHQELQQLQKQPLVYCWSLEIAVLLGGRPDHNKKHCTFKLFILAVFTEQYIEGMGQS